LWTKKHYRIQSRITPFSQSMVATIFKFDKELTRHVPRRIRFSLPFVTKRCLYVWAIRIRMNLVMRAANTYSWRNSFAGNYKEGSVSSCWSTPFLPRAICLRSTRAIHYRFTLNQHTSCGVPVSVYCICDAYLAIDPEADRPEIAREE